MTTTTTEVEELDRSELEDLGIDVPDDFVSAFRVDADAINILVHDPYGGSYLDDPKDDRSGEDAWEWIGFNDGRERDEWRAEHGDEPNLVWIERYEHSLVCYAPIGESSQVDRQWDVAEGVAVIRFTKPETFGSPLLEVARGICEEYTSWCNGDTYGIVSFRRLSPLDAPNCPVLLPDEFATERWDESGSCWGFIGREWAEQSAKSDRF